MEDLPFGQAVRRVDGGDRRVVLVMGAAGEMVNYGVGHLSTSDWVKRGFGVCGRVAGEPPHGTPTLVAGPTQM